MATLVHRFPGGLPLPAHTSRAGSGPIRACPLPPQLRIALLQHAGGVAEALVAAGDVVVAGQVIGRPAGVRGADVHAPAAGRVHAVQPLELATMPGVQVLHVLLDLDAGQVAPAPVAFAPLAPLDAVRASRGELLERIRRAGIAGLGGAGFPSAEKLAVAREVLVLNGAECEPDISCDDALLRERAGDVIHGALLLQRIAGATRVVLALEDRMVDAMAACTAAIGHLGADGIELLALPTRYPQGGERQLIEAVTGREVPRGGLPRDIGVVVHNVATAAAAWRAVHGGQPLCTRIVTVAGDGVARPGNYEVAIGTPVAELIAAAGGYTADAARLVMGGPMMGTALAHDGFPVAKTTNCILVQGCRDLGHPDIEMPCIRCGDCAGVCPARLQPQQLLWQVRAAEMDRARSDGLMDCIECGCCDLACPSHIPLTQHFRHARALLRRADEEAAVAADAKRRHDARQVRMQRQQAERAERSAARQATLESPDAVAAAIARARARRGSS